ncbi:hypothetical protein AAGG43_10610 [Bacillus paranthracis]
MKKKTGLLLSLTLAASAVLGACGNSDKASSDKKSLKLVWLRMLGALMTNHLTNQLGKV